MIHLRFIHLLLIFSCLTAFNAKSQDHAVDSIWNTIDIAEHDTTKAKGYNDLAGLLYFQSLDTVVYFSGKAIDICLFNLSEKILNEAEHTTFMRFYADAINNMGFVQSERGNYSRAMEQYYNALAIQNKIDDKEGQAWSYNNIGYIFFIERNWDPCFENYNKALDLFQEIEDQPGIGRLLNNLGIAYRQSGDTLLALNYYKQSLENAELRESKHDIAIALNNIGNLEMLSGDNHAALVNFQRALKLNEELKSASGMSASFRLLGRAFLMEGEYDVAEAYGLESLRLGREANRPRHEMGAAALLADVYMAEGKFELGWEMDRLEHQLADSLDTETAQQLSMQRNLEFEFEKEKAVQEAEHARDIELAQAKERNQNYVLVGIGAVLLLMVIFLFYVFNRLKHSRRQNLIIDAQKKIVEVKNQEITDSITYAKRIQKAIIPSNERMKTELRDYFVFYLPKDIVAGDFYWLKTFGNLTYIAVADCTGHGVPGAMVSIVCNNALNRSVMEFEIRDPAKILEKTRELVVEELDENKDGRVKDGMDISLCCLDRSNGNLEWAGANNPLWIIRNGSDEMEILAADKQPIGKYDQNEPFTCHQLDLNKGDQLYLFSDGFADQFGGEKGKKYYYSNFKKFLLKNRLLSLEEQEDKLVTELISWKGALEQLDDICVIGIKI